MYIAIIGAGAAGLVAARRCSDPKSGASCQVFEQTGQLGGTWVYSERIGSDEYGFPVHSSMYKGLKTNLPKEVMGYPDFPIPEQEKSYLSHEEILDFLNSYADHFNLKKFMKFYTRVKDVTPIENNRWSIKTVDVRTKEEAVTEFDGVMVCNGHYNEPFIPDLPGKEVFNGKQIHSHDYRKPEHFKGQTVLIIGAGYSGMDLTIHISNFAEKVYLSHHSKELINTKFPENILQKPDVEYIKETGVKFKDGTEAFVNIICYCTGYKYSFPFLNEMCGIKTNENHITPLYKHMINIEYPTMSLIGIPFYVCAFQMFDLQVRYFLKTLLNPSVLPTKEEMHRATNEEMLKRWERGYTKKQAHSMNFYQLSYYNDLAQTAEANPIPPALVKLMEHSIKRITEDLFNFRNDIYKIIDDHNYIKIN